MGNMVKHPKQEDPIPLSDEAEIELQKHERRTLQGLDYFPFDDGLGRFYKIGPEASYTKHDANEVLRIVSSWYVKKNNAYHDVDNLQVKYQPHDIKQVVVQRMREVFPKWELSDQGWRDFFKVLLDPPVNKLNPERSIPVWSGKTQYIPRNSQKVIFSQGTASVNTWSPPAYRNHPGVEGTAFTQFLRYVIPEAPEREVFLDWLAWNLQNEGRKASWAVMLYSEKQGTGKSTLADVMKALFGTQNTGRINGVNKLVGRFNKEVLDNKLVIVEEVEVKRGSSQANRLKSLVTEDSTMVEAKNMPIYLQDISCTFLMTTNHLPLWLEESDRRFFILNFDHQGYANGGPEYVHFIELVSALKQQISTVSGIKGIYDQLMQRDVTADFGLKLDVSQHQTSIMKRLKDLSPDVAKQLLEETLENNNIVFVPVSYAHRLINSIAPREVNAQSHIFPELGWLKGKFAWSGGPQSWAWYRMIDPEKPPSRGKVYAQLATTSSHRDWQNMSEQVNRIKDILWTAKEKEQEDKPEDMDAFEDTGEFVRIKGGT
jgi:hypothetical protein